MSAKILLLDCETAPAVVYVWGLYDEVIGTNQIIDDGYMLCWCAKWLGKKGIMSDSLVNYTSYTRNPRDDSKIAGSMWALLDKADIVVTHNGNKFDLKWLNTVFTKHGLKPVSGYKSVDTLAEVRKRFRFISNKLDFICRKLGLGKKLSTGGFELWDECMKGEKLAWNKLVTYCKHDVSLLEKLYLHIRPFIQNHPNLSLYSDGERMCPNCGSYDFHARGFEYTLAGKYQKFCCKMCGKRFSDRSRKELTIKTRGV